MAHHKMQVDGFTSLTELAETVGNLRYDALAEFLGALEQKLQRDSAADAKRERNELSGYLHAARYDVGAARLDVERAWKICERFMALSDG